MDKISEEKDKERYKIITVEEHFSTPEHLDQLRAILDKKYPQQDVINEERFIASDAPFLPIFDTPPVREMVGKLTEVGSGRVKVMDQAGIDMQVLSFVAPGVHVFDTETGIAMAKNMNDQLSKIVKEHPTRFAGLAALALQDPDVAADELERSVMDLGLKGACITSHTKGEYPDEKKYRVVFRRAHRLGVPIYLHPRAPSPAMIKPYLDYPFMDSPMLGFAAEAGLSAMRLICSGLFDEYPNLKILLGHLGEAIPFWFSRMDNFWEKSPLAESFRKTPSQYFKDNFFVTTSGMFFEPALLYTLSVLGADNILFALDYPMEDPEEGVAFMDASSISIDDKEKIYHLNAERIFAL